MAFIRLKRRILGGKDVFYAYLVKNRWDKKEGSPRQTVSRYLGRVIELKERKELDFLAYTKAKDYASYAADCSRAKIITDLANWEIASHDASASAGKNGVKANDKDVVLKLNEGYMCAYTLNRLFNFKTSEEDPHYVGVELATRLSEAGIRIPKELFVVIYDKFAGVTY